MAKKSDPTETYERPPLWRRLLKPVLENLVETVLVLGLLSFAGAVGDIAKRVYSQSPATAIWIATSLAVVLGAIAVRWFRSEERTSKRKRRQQALKNVEELKELLERCIHLLDWFETAGDAGGVAYERWREDARLTKGHVQWWSESSSTLPFDIRCLILTPKSAPKPKHVAPGWSEGGTGDARRDLAVIEIASHGLPQALALYRKREGI